MLEILALVGFVFSWFFIHFGLIGGLVKIISTVWLGWVLFVD